MRFVEVFAKHMLSIVRDELLYDWLMSQAAINERKRVFEHFFVAMKNVPFFYFEGFVKLELIF